MPEPEIEDSNDYSLDEIKTALRRKLNKMQPDERETALRELEGDPNFSGIVDEYRYPTPGAWTEEAFKPAAPVPRKPSFWQGISPFPIRPESQLGKAGITTLPEAGKALWREQQREAEVQATTPAPSFLQWLPRREKEKPVTISDITFPAWMATGVIPAMSGVTGPGGIGKVPKKVVPTVERGAVSPRVPKLSSAEIANMADLRKRLSLPGGLNDRDYALLQKLEAKHEAWVTQAKPSVVPTGERGAVGPFGEAKPPGIRFTAFEKGRGPANPQEMYNWARGALQTDELSRRLTQATTAPRLTAKNRAAAMKIIRDAEKAHPEWKQAYEAFITEAVTPAAAAAKESWQMPRVEWKQAVLADSPEYAQRSQETRRMIDRGHRESVQQALSEGKLSVEDYNRLHAKDYGPIEQFAPDLAAKGEPTLTTKRMTIAERNEAERAKVSQQLSELEAGRLRAEAREAVPYEVGDTVRVMGDDRVIKEIIDSPQTFGGKAYYVEGLNQPVNAQLMNLVAKAKPPVGAEVFEAALEAKYPGKAVQFYGEEGNWIRGEALDEVTGKTITVRATTKAEAQSLLDAELAKVKPLQQVQGKPPVTEIPKTEVVSPSEAGLWLVSEPQDIEKLVKAGAKLYLVDNPQNIEALMKAGARLWPTEQPQDIESLMKAGAKLWLTETPQDIEKLVKPGARLFPTDPQDIEKLIRNRGRLTAAGVETEETMAKVKGTPPPPPPKLPSGRVPGGPTGPLPPRPDPYEQLVDSLTPRKPSIKDMVTAARDRVLRAMYWEAYPLRDLAKRAKIPVDDLYQIVSGMAGSGEENARLFVKPIIDRLGRKLVPRFQEYLTLMTEEDLAARSPAAKLPGNIPGLAGILKAKETLRLKVEDKVFAQIEAAAAEYWKVHDQFTLKALLDEGIIDNVDYVAMKSANPHYLDLHRADFSMVDQLEGRLTRPTANLTTTGLKLRQLEGSIRGLDDPLGRTTMQIIKTPMLIARNRAAKAIGQALREVQGAEEGPLFRLLKPSETGENSNVLQTISWFEKGEQVRAVVPAEFGFVAKNAEAEAANAFSKFFRTISAPLRSGATTYSLGFITRNPLFDSISGMFQIGMSPFTSKEYWKGWWAVLTKNQNFTDAAHAGVYMSGLLDSARDIKSIARSAQRGVFTVRSWQDALLVIPRVMQEAGITGERATRTGGYLFMKARGASELTAAIKGGRDITVDFSKSGTVMKLINQAIPFANAGTQGLANIIRTTRNDPMKALKRVSPLAFISAMVWVNNKRFDSSDKIDNSLYYRNWPIQIGEYTEAPDPRNPDAVPEKKPIVIKIPKGPIAGPLLMPVETILRGDWKQGNRSITEDMLATTRGMALAASPFSPDISGLAPPLVGTAFQVATGQDVYRGGPIIPKREQGLLPEQQFGPEISKVAIALGQKFKVSPRLIDFAINDYTAGAGQSSSWLAGMALESLGYKPEQYGAAFAQPATTVQKVSAIPGVSSYLSTRGNRIENLEWEDLSRQVEATQRAIAESPEINRLGITFGMVGDEIKGTKLTLPQRTDYQGVAGLLARDRIAQVTASPYYQSLDDNYRKEFIQKELSQSRQIARAAIDNFKPQDNPTFEDSLNIAKQAQAILQPYFDIESSIWAEYPPEVRQQSDRIDKETSNDREVYTELLKLPSSIGTSIIRARERIAGSQIKMKGSPATTLSKTLKVYNSY